VDVPGLLARFCPLPDPMPEGLAVERLSHDEVVAAFVPGHAPATAHATVVDLAGRPIEARALRPAVEPPVALVWRRDRTAPPAARAFVEFVRAATRPAGAGAARRRAAP